MPSGTAVVIGATGGIGGALVQQLKGGGRYKAVVALSRTGAPVGGVDRAGRIDITDEASIAAAAASLTEGGSSADGDNAMGDVRLVIVAAGLLHEPGYGPEKTMRSLSAEDLLRAFAVNAVGPALVAKHFLPLLSREGRSIFAALSARVGSISDNRLGGWYGYRASKAALNQLIRTLAIEHARKRPDGIVVALHPGTVDTALSQPFRANVPEEQLFTPAHSAEQLLAVLDGLRPEDSGRLFAWDGDEVAP